MALTKITSSVVAVNSLTAANIADNSIDATKIANNQILARHIANATALTLDGGVTIDNITIDGTEIDLSSGDLTLDVAGDIILDVAGSDVIYKRSGTSVGEIQIGDDNFNIRSLVSDKDIVFKGNDAGTTVTALTLDMSDAGKAIFTNNVSITSTGEGLSVARSGYDTYALQQSTGSGVAIYNVTDSRNEMHFIGDGTVGVGTTGTSGYGHFVVNSSGVQVALRASSGTAGLGFFEAGAGRFYLKTLDGADGLAFIDGDGSTEHMRIDANGNISLGGGANASNFSNYVTLDLRDTTGGIIDFSEASAGVHSRIQAVVNNSLNILNRQNYPLHLGTNDTTRLTITGAGNVGIGNTNPQHPFIVHLTDGEIAMFGSNGMNAVGAYAGIGLGQVLADNTTYQKVQIVAEGRNSGSYVSNLHFLVDTAADSGSAVLADSKMMISGENGYLGVGLTAPKSRAEFHLDQVAAATDVNATASVHFGSQQHTDGAMMGITLGYREASMNYRKVGIFAEGRADNAARQNLLLCVDTASDANSCRDADAKITIDGLSGECKIGNTTVETETYCLKVQTQHGYGRQGSANSSYFHHETDRAYNYWNEAGYFSGGAHTYSDETLKKDVVVIPDALASVAKMNGVTFNWIDPEKRGGKGTGTGKQFGVIAQNMLEVDAELPTLSVDPLAAGGNEETDDKLYSMDYARLSPYFIEAIKELKTKLEAAEARIKTLEG